MVHPGHLSCLSADEGTARLLTAHSDSLHHLSSDRDVEFAAAVVIKEVERLGTLHDQIVDGHGH
jgi:hypothetical protein